MCHKRSPGVPGSQVQSILFCRIYFSLLMLCRNEEYFPVAIGDHESVFCRASKLFAKLDSIVFEFSYKWITATHTKYKTSILDYEILLNRNYGIYSFRFLRTSSLTMRSCVCFNYLDGNVA